MRVILLISILLVSFKASAAGVDAGKLLAWCNITNEVEVSAMSDRNSLELGYCIGINQWGQILS